MSDTAVETIVVPETVEPAQDTDWKAEARKWESRAKENLTKATTNEGAAKRLAEIEEANKTESEKVSERLAAAEKRAGELEATVLRSKVAEVKGVPAGLLTGSTQEELEASADALVAFRGEQRQAPASAALNRVNTSSVSGDDSAFARSLFTDN